MFHKLLSLVLCAVPALAAQGDRAIDVQHSTIRIHVGKAGLFSAAGHEHWVSAPIASGVLNSSQRRVELQVHAAKLEVEPDPKDTKHQAEIQQTMQEKALESARYPEIAFRSTAVEETGSGQWNVKGSLTLHGVTKPVSMSVTRKDDAYSGTVVLKQTDFGIKPISVGGVVKVKNELEIAFKIVAR